MGRLSIRKTLVFKGKQHYAVFDNWGFKDSAGKRISDVGNRWKSHRSRRISGNFSDKRKAVRFLRRTQKDRMR